MLIPDSLFSYLPQGLAVLHAYSAATLDHRDILYFVLEPGTPPASVTVHDNTLLSSGGATLLILSFTVQDITPPVHFNKKLVGLVFYICSVKKYFQIINSFMKKESRFNL